VSDLSIGAIATLANLCSRQRTVGFFAEPVLSSVEGLRMKLAASGL